MQIQRLFSGIFLVLATCYYNRATAQKSAPVAGPDSYTTGLNTPLNVSQVQGVLANDTDSNGTAGLTVNPTPVSGPTNGNLLLNADGSFTYIPNAGFSGNDTFTYQVCDDGTPHQVVSRFDFDTANLALATIGPDATSVNPIAVQTGCGIRIGAGSGGSTGIDVMVPNTGGIFDFTSFSVSFEYRDQEGTADIVTAGNFRIWHIGANNLGIQLNLIDGITGVPISVTQNLGAFAPGSSLYTLSYNELNGNLVYTVNGATTVYNLAPAYSPLNSALSSPLQIGRFMDNSGTALPSLCSIAFTDTSVLCGEGLVTVIIPTSVIMNRRITYRVDRN